MKLPDGSTVTADNPQLAHAGRLVPSGASLDDAAGQAQITVLPRAPRSMSQSPQSAEADGLCAFHRSPSDGAGQRQGLVERAGHPVEEMPTGPNFLAGLGVPQVQTAPCSNRAGGANWVSIYRRTGLKCECGSPGRSSELRRRAEVHAQAIDQIVAARADNRADDDRGANRVRCHQVRRLRSTMLRPARDAALAREQRRHEQMRMPAWPRPPSERIGAERTGRA